MPRGNHAQVEARRTPYWPRATTCGGNTDHGEEETPSVRLPDQARGPARWQCARRIIGRARREASKRFVRGESDEEQSPPGPPTQDLAADQMLAQHDEPRAAACR